VSHTPEKWYTLERKGRISHDYGKTIIPASQIVLTDENLARADLCVNALAGVADPAAEIERLRQIEKQWHEDQMRARADSKATKAVLEAAGLEVLGWSVNCPPGHEHDTLLFGDGDDAHEQAELFNSDCPEGESPHVAVPLYAIDPAQVAKWRAMETVLRRACRECASDHNGMEWSGPQPAWLNEALQALAAKGGK